MDTIKEFDVLDEQVFNDIKEYVGNMNLKFENSLLYDGVEKKKLHDDTKRKSIFSNITDDGLFDRFEKLIGKVNELVEGKKYTLVRNDVMYIKYKEGDFFESHTDFLTFKTNLFQEYTFILCLDAECVGGETVFTVNNPNPSQNTFTYQTELHNNIVKRIERRKSDNRHVRKPICIRRSCTI